MTAYIIAIRERVRIAEEYQEYKRLAPLTIHGAPLERITRDGSFEVLEGADADGVSIIAFPSYQHARDWYESEEYRPALEHRLRGTDFRLILVDGADAEKK